MCRAVLLPHGHSIEWMAYVQPSSITLEGRTVRNKPIKLGVDCGAEWQADSECSGQAQGS